MAAQWKRKSELYFRLTPWFPDFLAPDHCRSGLTFFREFALPFLANNSVVLGLLFSGHGCSF